MHLRSSGSKHDRFNVPAQRVKPSRFPEAILLECAITTAFRGGRVRSDPDTCGCPQAPELGVRIFFGCLGLWPAGFQRVDRRCSSRDERVREPVCWRRAVSLPSGEGRFVRDGCGHTVTPLKTTLLDCLCQANFSQGLAIADSALHWRLVDADGLREHVERSGFRRKGIRTARRVLRWMDGRSDNGGESMARAVMIELGFQLPELQVEVADPLTPGGMWRVDFCWRLPDGRVVIGELDGGGKYLADGEGAAEALDHMRRERLRESRLNLTGAMVIRFSFEQAMDRAYMERLLRTPESPPRGCVPLRAFAGFCAGRKRVAV